MYSAQSQHVAGVFLAKHAEKNVDACTADVRWDGSWQADVKHTQLSVRQSVCIHLCVQWWRDQLWVEQTQLIPALCVSLWGLLSTHGTVTPTPRRKSCWMVKKKKLLSLVHILLCFTETHLYECRVFVTRTSYLYTSDDQWGAQCSQGVLLQYQISWGKNRPTNVTEKKWQFN